MKPRFNVVGAAIIKEGKVLALRRADGIESVVHKFEFVGGKIEQGETPQTALKRECIEELSLEIEVGDLLNTIEYEYPDFTVVLSVYCATALSEYVVKEHEEDKWIACDELDAEEWAPADREFLRILKNGYVKICTAETDGDFLLIGGIADSVMHETFDETVPEGQVDYMLNLFLTPDAMRRNVGDKGYKYKIVYLNGEAAGFFAYCPAKNFDPQYEEGVFLSKLYILGYAQGKGIATRIFNSLRRPVYLTVKRDNVQAINVYKHSGFKIIQSVSTDIGQGYVMDDYVMALIK